MYLSNGQKLKCLVQPTMGESVRKTGTLIHWCGCVNQFSVFEEHFGNSCQSKENMLSLWLSKCILIRVH